MKNKIIAISTELFFKRGYQGVTLHDISQKLQIKPASLYYYFKGGKEEIYLDVIKARVQSFKEAIETIANKENSLEQILLKFGYWYINQTPMNMILIAEFDMPHLTQRGQMRAMKDIGQYIFEPLQKIFSNYSSILRSDIELNQVVGTFNLLLYSTPTAAKMSGKNARDLVDYNISVLLNGIKK